MTGNGKEVTLAMVDALAQVMIASENLEKYLNEGKDAEDKSIVAGTLFATQAAVLGGLSHFSTEVIAEGLAEAARIYKIGVESGAIGKRKSVQSDSKSDSKSEKVNWED